MVRASALRFCLQKDLYSIRASHYYYYYYKYICLWLWKSPGQIDPKLKEATHCYLFFLSFFFFFSLSFFFFFLWPRPPHWPNGLWPYIDLIFRVGIGSLPQHNFFRSTSWLLWTCLVICVRGKPGVCIYKLDLHRERQHTWQYRSLLKATRPWLWPCETASASMTA